VRSSLVSARIIFWTIGRRSGSKKHVLGAAQADADRAVRAGALGTLGMSELAHTCKPRVCGHRAGAQRARSYGAVGIGLCRTEHMFFEPERLPIVQKMILAETSEERTKQLNLLLPSKGRTSTACSKR